MTTTDNLKARITGNEVDGFTVGLELDGAPFGQRINVGKKVEAARSQASNMLAQHRKKMKTMVDFLVDE